MVVHYDPWWNLAAQNQATDRAHRIGQQKHVTVYKLITKDSIEEKVLELQETKRELADRIRKTGIRRICTGHCTGERAMEILKEELGAMAEQIYTGFEIDV